MALSNLPSNEEMATKIQEALTEREVEMGCMRCSGVTEPVGGRFSLPGKAHELSVEQAMAEIDKPWRPSLYSWVAAVCPNCGWTAWYHGVTLGVV